MDWIFYTKILAFIVTVIIVWLVGKEIIDSIKRSNRGEKSKKWDID